jgi:STE24 endopeptidase
MAWYDGWLSGFSLHFIVAGLAFFLLLSLVQTALGLPFDLYNHFKIETRFGFNNMSLKLWSADQIKSLLLSTLFFAILGSAAFWLIQAAPQSWWLWVWGLIISFSLIMMIISPYVIEPLFFKFEPLQVEGLEADIRTMMEKTGLSVSKVLQVDASKRSGHSNAYFTGFGKQKRVVLFDTLLQQLSKEEILAVLAHELGHMKKKHILKRMLLMAVVALFYCWLAHTLIGWQGLPMLVGMEEASFYARVVILFFISGILTFPLTPLSSILSRRDEYEADRFACDLHGNPEDLATALVQMCKENLSNLHPHPIYARFYYSHPPVVERVRHLREQQIK